MNIRVSALRSPRSGRDVPNQYHLYIDGVHYFQSYTTIVAKQERGEITLDTGYPYSRTTGKYLKQFTGHSVTELRQMVKDGRVQVADLNS